MKKTLSAYFMFFQSLITCQAMAADPTSSYVNQKLYKSFVTQVMNFYEAQIREVAKGEFFEQAKFARDYPDDLSEYDNDYWLKSVVNSMLGPISRSERVNFIPEEQLITNFFYKKKNRPSTSSNSENYLDEKINIVSLYFENQAIKEFKPVFFQTIDVQSFDQDLTHYMNAVLIYRISKNLISNGFLKSGINTIERLFTFLKNILEHPPYKLNNITLSGETLVAHTFELMNIALNQTDFPSSSPSSVFGDLLINLGSPYVGAYSKLGRDYQENTYILSQIFDFFIELLDIGTQEDIKNSVAGLLENSMIRRLNKKSSQNMNKSDFFLLSRIDIFLMDNAPAYKGQAPSEIYLRVKSIRKKIAKAVPTSETFVRSYDGFLKNEIRLRLKSCEGLLQEFKM